MWTRTYLLLLVVRIYFALAPSYIHPDENFQGPEVIAGTFLDNPSLSIPPICDWQDERRPPQRRCVSRVQRLMPCITLAHSIARLRRSHLPRFTLGHNSHSLSCRDRQHLFLPSPPDMGVHLRQTRTECLPTMARLRPPHGRPPLDLVGYWDRRGPSPGRVLYLTHLNVYFELRS